MQICNEVMRMLETEIRFYRASEKPYGAFSNLFRRPVTFEGETFATSEHAYQAGKARKPEVKRWLMEAPSPALLAMAAHGLYYWDVAPGWSKTKFDRMRRVLYSKFTQHPDLMDLLLSTGDAKLIETATVDNEVNRLWGEVNGNGRNMLGEMLMELRAQLRIEQLQADEDAGASDVSEVPMMTDPSSGYSGRAQHPVA
jgi:ribA/ribD-fused uncharacterized protein